MRSRLKLLLLLVACLVSLLPVLHVNNALDIAEITSGDSPGPPVIEFTFEDPCDSLRDVLMTVVVTPEQAYLEIDSFVDHSSPCKGEPFALIFTSNLRLRMSDGRVARSDFSLATGPTPAKSGTLERTAGGSSSFRVPLAGDSDARYQFASGALGAGFGESSLQVQLMARNLTCPEPSAVQGGQAAIAEKHCAIPLRAILQYANAEFDIAAALPPTYYLVTGSNLGGRKSTKGYPTTRLVWAERATTPSSVIKGTLTGFEIHLVDRRSVARKQFITVAGSAVFGTFVSMLLAFMASSQSKTTGESTGRHDPAAPEQALPRTPPPTSPRQGQEPGRSQVVDRPPGATEFAPLAQAPAGPAVWVSVLVVAAALAVCFLPSQGRRAGRRRKAPGARVGP